MEQGYYSHVLHKEGEVAAGRLGRHQSEQV
jgi:hypothetical protein